MATFSAVGQSSALYVRKGKPVSLAITGTFNASIVLEKKAPGAGGWIPLRLFTAAKTTTLDAPAEDTTYRLNCTRYVSGTVTYALATASQSLEKWVDQDGAVQFEIKDDGLHAGAAALDAATIAALIATLLTLGSEDALTAHAGGGQSSALALDATKAMHRIATVATAADSVKLPAAVVGAVHLVINDAASNAMQVFGTGSDTVNGAASGTGVSHAAGKAAMYVCASAGKWYRLLSA
jgi:hypothetical protein